MPASVSPLTRAYAQHIGPLKSRRGCKSCKIRKIKCGEEKPTCRRCLLAKYKCEYRTPPSTKTHTYSSAPLTLSTSILDLPVSTFPNTVWRERRAFAYYFHHAAHYLSGGIDQEFWVSIVPSVCRGEPALWDAVNAISTLFENPKICADFVFLSLRHTRVATLTREQSEALGWYARSLAKIRGQIERGDVDAHVALISSVLFMCVETLQGHVEDALRLFQQGVRLILDLRMRQTSSGQSVLLEKTIVPLFIRLGTAALTLSGVPVCDLFNGVMIEGDYVFRSLQAARDALVPLAAEILVLEREAGTNPFVERFPDITEEMEFRHAGLQQRLQQWHRAFTSFTELALSKTTTTTTAEISTTALLIAFHTTLTIVLSTCLTRPSASPTSTPLHDTHLPSFRTVITQAEIALCSSTNPTGTPTPFTFELGVGLPLFHAAMHCRDPKLRRKALSLLERAPPMQGFHKCGPGIMISRKIMELEEGFAGVRWGCDGDTSTEMDTKTNPKSNSNSNTETQIVNENDNEGDNKYQEENEDEDQKTVTKTIPLSARIQHYAFFRPRENPALVGPHDITKWNRGPEQMFLRFTRVRGTRLEDDCVDEGGQQGWRGLGLTDELVPMDLDLA
ncbi:hypothetical protein BJX70DRAFT_409757 [Aspergillus crustosus]